MKKEILQQLQMKKFPKQKDKHFCPNCKEDLREVGVGYGQQGTQFYNVTIDKRGVVYKNDEFQADDGGEFYCNDCGDYLGIADEDEIIKLLN